MKEDKVRRSNDGRAVCWSVPALWVAPVAASSDEWYEAEEARRRREIGFYVSGEAGSMTGEWEHSEVPSQRVHLITDAAYAEWVDKMVGHSWYLAAGWSGQEFMTQELGLYVVDRLEETEEGEDEVQAMSAASESWEQPSDHRRERWLRARAYVAARRAQAGS